MVPLKYANSWLLASLLLVLLLLIDSALCKTVNLPQNGRTEGRLVLSYVRGSSILTHEYTFSEYLNAAANQTKITMTTSSRASSIYYKRNSTILMISKSGLCKPAAPAKTFFVPEIAWFFSIIYSAIDKKDLTGEIGPTGFLRLFLTKSKDFVLNRSEMHRNIDCYVYTQNNSNVDVSIELEVFIPKKTMEKFEKLNLPTAKGKIKFNKPELDIREASFEIDYFYIGDLDDPLKLVDDRSSLDSNFPEAKGCSLHLNKVDPNLQTKSFTMIYKKEDSPGYTMMAYDKHQNLLKKESISEQSTIWDLDEEMLYNMQPNVTNLLHDQFGLSEYTGTCSAINVADQKLSSAYRPYQQPDGQALDIKALLGAKRLAYIGRGKVRELPSVIYETVTKQVPLIFGYSNDTYHWKQKNPNSEFIVQFHLVESLFKDGAELAGKIDDDSFWPARITLFGLQRELEAIVKLDQIDIHDFYWSLDGRNKRRTELFVAEECFSDEDEQVRLEVSLTFDGIHTGVVDESRKNLLAANKFKLEYDLLNEICEILGLTRIHLISSVLSLRPNHVLLDVTFGDRKDSKVLTYFGEGELVSSSSYLNNRMVVTDLPEDKCLMLGSHIHEISMVVYCPKAAGTQESTCTSIYSEEEPTIRFNTDSDDRPLCHVYRYKLGGPPKKGASKVLENSRHLSALSSWTFGAAVPRLPKTTFNLTARLEDYDVSHHMKLITISSHLVAKDLSKSDGDETLVVNPNVVSIAAGVDGTGVEIKDAHDCARICNLDPWCRSFSYCSLNNVCSVTKLDLRESKVQERLMRDGAAATSGRRTKIQVSDVERYELLFKQGCNVYERNYLNMFNPTNEIVRMRKSDAERFPKADTTFECAKLSVGSEMMSGSHHVAVFAFCPSQDVNSCLLDENLFKETSSHEAPPTIDEDQFVRCRIYKRRFHTYFNVSSKVLSVATEPSLQVKLPFKTVEECARACWTQFGQVCSSFDLCTGTGAQGGPCVINQVLSLSPEVKLEMRPGCLHYERDLRFDKILAEHMIGRHEPLALRPESPSTGRIWSQLLTFVTYCFVGCVFVYGMCLGPRANRELDNLMLRFKSSQGPSASHSSFVNFHNNSYENNAYRDGNSRSGSADSGTGGIELADVRRTIN